MAQAIETVGAAVKPTTAARKLDRSVIDRLISWAGMVLAVALIGLGGAAWYGGSFALDNVRDRLEPQKVSFPPISAMSAEEKAAVGDFAGQRVDTGPEAEAFSRYIGGHLAFVNDGKTYSETSGEAHALSTKAEETTLTKAEEAKLAELSGKTDTLFRGETLRSMLLNAYAWWTVGQITMWAGIGMVLAGLILAVLVALGFRHARKAAASTV